MSTSNPDHSLDGESKSEMMIGLSVGLWSLCTVLVGARIYTRAILLKNAGIDDFMIVVTHVISTGLNIATILEAHFGVGKHSWLASAETSVKQLQCLFSAIQLYIWALCLVKISLLLQYRRIFVAQWLQRAAIFIIGFAVIWNMIQSALVTLACVPMTILYPSLADKCLDSLTIWYIAAAINIVTDFIVFLMPIPLVQSLQLPLRQRLLLCLVFGLGLFTCVISIVRATTLYLVVVTDDASWYGAEAATWSMVEVNCAIICSCLPTLRYLLGQALPFLGLRTHSSISRGPFSSKSRRGSNGYALRSRKSNAPGLVGSNKTFGGSSERGGGGGSGGGGLERSRQDPAEENGNKWDANYDDTGLCYHSNYISAWVSTCPETNSPTRSSKTPSMDERSEKRLVDASISEQDLSQHIVITRTTHVEEERSDDPRTSVSSPGRAL